MSRFTQAGHDAAEKLLQEAFSQYEGGFGAFYEEGRLSQSEMRECIAYVDEASKQLFSALEFARTAGVDTDKFRIEHPMEESVAEFAAWAQYSCQRQST